jgi:hypothetical protein
VYQTVLCELPPKVKTVSRICHLHSNLDSVNFWRSRPPGYFAAKHTQAKKKFFLLEIRGVKRIISMSFFSDKK